MNVKTLKNKKIVLIDEILSIYFISSVDNFKTNADSELKLSDSLFLNILKSQQATFKLSNNNPTSNCISLKLDFDILLETRNDLFIFAKGDKTFVLNCENSQFEFDKEEVLTIRFSDKEVSLNLNYYENFFVSKLDFSAGATNLSNVDEDTFMPEFSISVFDDSGFTKPRPIRQGVPIVSTVPSFIDINSSSTDQNYYELGEGPNLKTLYLRIICNKVMENISFNQLSAMTLKVYMPNGLDTVKTAIYRPMYLVENDSTNNISIYRASHDFYVQGVFDGIEYVDGYMYCDVQVPLTITKSIPVEFDFILYDL
jgi:hypothetical protein